MIYLKKFTLLDENQEYDIMRYEERRRFDNYYPLRLFSSRDFKYIDFDNITIFYGNNGSGKTTLINIISKKLNALRKLPIDKGSFFDLYVKHCDYEMDFEYPSEIKVISSDDVFNYLLDIRSINANANRERERLSKEYLSYKFSKDNISFDNYNELKTSYEAKKKTMSSFVRKKLGNNIVEQSNGESALIFWEREIKENGIYILDEPENSLSAENQLKLKNFIEESVRFYNCQFIISTHSPFLLKLDSAKIYDLDDVPVNVKKWNELPNVLVYYNFFKEYKNEFEE